MGTAEIITKLRSLKELQTLIDEAQTEAEAIKNELKAYMTEKGTDEITVDVYKVRYKAVSGTRFDSAAFKRENGELYSRYVKPTVTRRFSVA